MPRMKKKVSKAIQNAAARAAGMESIDPAPDFGVNLTVPAFVTAVGDAQEKQAAYNTQLAKADEARNVFRAAEASIADLSDRMLAATAGKFGRNSNEYVKAGGKRKVDRKRTTGTPVPVDPASPVVKAA